MIDIQRIKIDDIDIDSTDKIVFSVIKYLPKNFYVTKDILYCNENREIKKTTYILSTLYDSHVVSIKILETYNSYISNELLYLSKYHNYHYFYKNCYLAFCRYKNFNISIIRYKKADGDISNLILKVSDYALLYKMINYELSKMHYNNIVHMDIKITNILYIKNKDNYKFGLCDFELINNADNIYNIICPKFRKYYKLLYIKKYIPPIYTIKFEKKVLNYIMTLIKKNYKIIPNSI